MKHYDYLIVGSGLFGAVFAYEARKRGRTVLVLERRDRIGGNIRTDEIEGIQVHSFGAHIVYTDSLAVWNYLQQFCTMNRFTNQVIARFGEEQYNLPFNMNTFYQLWGVRTPEEAQKRIAEQRVPAESGTPRNLEEHVLALVGRDIYEKLIKGYTEKQWGMPASELPASTMRRIPLRFTYDNNYYNARYEGVPEEGYTAIIEKMLDGCDVLLNEDYLDHREKWSSRAERVLYTGTIDGYYDYRFGALQYRGLRFETRVMDTPNYQGSAVINYTEKDVPYTRVIEHKHFVFGKQPKTVVSWEYPTAWKLGDEPFYPINNDRNTELYRRYRELADREEKVFFGGRLGSYAYYNMSDVVQAALGAAAKELDGIQKT